jgi:hypothetical protein
VARRVSKQDKLAEWQISKIGKVARQIGTVQATDADAADREVRDCAGAARQDRSAADRGPLSKLPRAV